MLITYTRLSRFNIDMLIKRSMMCVVLLICNHVGTLLLAAEDDKKNKVQKHFCMVIFRDVPTLLARLHWNEWLYNLMPQFSYTFYVIRNYCNIFSFIIWRLADEEYLWIYNQFEFGGTLLLIRYRFIHST